MTCAIITSIFGCLTTVALWLRYVAFHTESGITKLLFLGLALLIGCIPLCMGYQVQPVFGAFYPLYRKVLYAVYIGVVIFLTLTISQDILLLLFRFMGKNVAGVPKVLLILTVLLTVLALYEGDRVPRIRSLTQQSPFIKTPQKLVFMSDLHLTRFSNLKRLTKIVQKVNAQKPYAVFLGGDIVDDEVPFLTEQLKILKGLSAEKGIYFVTGNHEFYLGYLEPVQALINQGFHFLENTGADLGPVYVAGIPDANYGPYARKKPDITGSFDKASPVAYKILLSHTPLKTPHQPPYDLQLSGHTHGGQIFPFHIFTWAHNGFLAGFYPQDRLYVSRGAGSWGPQMRLFAPTEITVITLMPDKSN